MESGSNINMEICVPVTCSSHSNGPELHLEHYTRGEYAVSEDTTFSTQSAHRWRWGCQPHAPASLYPQEDSWYSFLSEAESTPGP
jgi:hypothetical protein